LNFGRTDRGSPARHAPKPAVLVVIFGYIFGSAISVPGGGNYRAYPVTASLAWTVLLLAVFVPLCTARYARPE
jgi:hypothetical protein